MRKIYIHFIYFFCLAAILSGCGQGLCPMRGSAALCTSGANGPTYLLGVLDTTWGTSGVGFSTIPGSNAGPNSIILQPDGKIVAGGYSNILTDDAIITRFNSDGSLDTTFATAGVYTYDGVVGTDSINKLVLLNSTHFLAMANSATATNFDMWVAKFNILDGSLDTTFGTAGYTYTDFSGSSDIAYDGFVDASNSIFLIGKAQSANNDFAIAKYTSSGILDTTWGTGGKITTNFSGNLSDNARAVAVQPDGKFVLAGDANGGNIALARYNSDGSLDTTFATTGMSAINYGGVGSARGIKLLSSGKFIVEGNYGATGFVSRYLANGTLDASFGVGGVFSQAGSTYGGGIDVQPDGKILVIDTVSTVLKLVRIKADGSGLDSTFGTGGIVTTNATPGFNSVPRTLLYDQVNGVVYVGGRAGSGGLYTIVARYK